MSVDAHVPSKEQIEYKKLLRPITWIAHVSMYGTGIAFLYWLDGLISLDWPAVSLIIILGIIYGLSLWALHRVGHEFNRRRS